MKEERVNGALEGREIDKPHKSGKPNAFVRFFSGIGKKCKEVVSELKKVTWPTFDKVLKNTGIVIVIVLLFMVVISLFDYGFGQILEAVTKIGE